MSQSSNSPAAYTYIRYSDRSQSRGDSTRRQIERAKDFAAKKGLRLDESTIYQDLGVSAFQGDNVRTGELGTFLSDVRDGKIERGSYLLVESFDRLSRQGILEALPTFMSLLKAGIIVVTLMDEVVHSGEAVDASWTSLILSMGKMAAANDESLKKSDRGAAAWAAKRAQLSMGVIATSRCPGWLKVEAKRFVIIEERAQIVRRIFDEFVGGLGREKIARRLNQAGVPPFGHGRSWHGGSVQKVTENAAVIGRYQPHSSSRKLLGSETGAKKSNGRTPVGQPIEDYYPAIIAPEIYLRAQQEARSKSVRPGNAGGRKGTVYSNLFSGIGVCVVCQKPIIFQHRGPRSRPVLRCSANKNGLCENEWRFVYHELEQQVLDWVEELVVVDTRSVKLKKFENEASRLEIERSQRTSQIKNLIDNFGAETPRFVVEKVRELQSEIDALTVRIDSVADSIRSVSSSPTTNQRRADLSAWRQAATTLEGPELFAARAKMAQSYRSIVWKMLFHRDGAVHIALKDTAKQYIFYLRDNRYEVKVYDRKRGSAMFDLTDDQLNVLEDAVAAFDALNANSSPEDNRDHIH